MSTIHLCLFYKFPSFVFSIHLPFSQSAFKPRLHKNGVREWTNERGKRDVNGFAYIKILIKGLFPFM